MNIDVSVATIESKPVKRAHNFVDLSGSKFSRLTITGEAPRQNGRIAWMCRCECGNEIIANADNLKSGRTQSCGCLQKEKAGQAQTTHGAWKGNKETPTHVSWRCMMARCYSEKNNRFKHYGGRGITVCTSWHNYANFLEDMGNRPEGLTLDRENTNGSYCKENCRWVTQKIQQNNRRNNRP